MKAIIALALFITVAHTTTIPHVQIPEPLVPAEPNTLVIPLPLASSGDVDLSSVIPQDPTDIAVCQDNFYVTTKNITYITSMSGKLVDSEYIFNIVDLTSIACNDSTIVLTNWGPIVYPSQTIYLDQFHFMPYDFIQYVIRFGDYPKQTNTHIINFRGAETTIVMKEKSETILGTNGVDITSFASGFENDIYTSKGMFYDEDTEKFWVLRIDTLLGIQYPKLLVYSKTGTLTNVWLPSGMSDPVIGMGYTDDDIYIITSGKRVYIYPK